jgi:hypothetical protein
MGLVFTLSAGTAVAQNRRAADSTKVMALCIKSNSILSKNPPTTTKSQRDLMLSTGRELETWATTYIKPKADSKSKERYFQDLVLAGRYYAWSGNNESALRVYRLADALYPQQHSAAGKVDKLLAYQKEIADGMKRSAELGGADVIIVASMSKSSRGSGRSTQQTAPQDTIQSLKVDRPELLHPADPIDKF